MNLLLDNQTNLDEISFKLNDELKDITYKELKQAQDYSSPYNLSKRTEYSMFHVRLDNYFRKIKLNKKPNNSDYLAWILLLTYPKDKIRSFNNIRDLNINFKSDDSNKTDFVIIDLLEKTEEDDMGTNYTCICSKPIKNIYKLQNKFSDIIIQLGCHCIERYGLVSKNQINECKKKMKDLKERNLEIYEGKPEGYYENERQLKKQEKEKTKLKRLEEKEKKKMEKEVNKLNKIQNDSFKIKNCIFCNKEGIHKTYEVGICSACVPCKIKLNNKNINNSIKNMSIYNECICCETDFINLKNDSEELCNNCKSIWTLERCKMCPENFIKYKEINDLYCPDCDDKIISCTDCNKKILKPSEKCKDCHRRFTNNLCVIKCQECDKEVEINIYDKKFKKHCNDCYKRNLQYVDCISCNIPFKRLIKEPWKKSCSVCYYKSK